MDPVSIKNLHTAPDASNQVYLSEIACRRWAGVCQTSAAMYFLQLDATGQPRPTQTQLDQTIGNERMALIGSIMVVWCDSPMGRIVMPLLPQEWRYRIPQPSMN